MLVVYNANIRVVLILSVVIIVSTGTTYYIDNNKLWL